jgi:hypothetical protein
MQFAVIVTLSTCSFLLSLALDCRWLSSDRSAAVSLAPWVNTSSAERCKDRRSEVRVLFLGTHTHQAGAFKPFSV